MSISRRELLTLAAAAVGGTLFTRSSPLAAWTQAQAPAATPADPLAAIRAQMGSIPIAVTPLGP